MFNWKNSKDTQARSGLRVGLFSWSGHAESMESRINDRIVNLSEALEKRLPERGIIKR